jgi:hypothetical protein
MLTGSSSKDLAAVCILTRPFRLQGHELNQTMHIYIVSKRDVSMAAMINLGAQSLIAPLSRRVREATGVIRLIENDRKDDLALFSSEGLPG